MPSVVACKGIGTYIVVICHEVCLINLCCLQAATTELESQLNDAKTRLAEQETEIKTTDSKLQLGLSETEKLKTSLAAKMKSWAKEKMLLIQRAETAKAALGEVTTELTGLKNHVSQMVSAIIGKSPYDCQILNILLYHMNCL